MIFKCVTKKFHTDQIPAFVLLSCLLSSEFSIFIILLSFSRPFKRKEMEIYIFLECRGETCDFRFVPLPFRSPFVAFIHVPTKNQAKLQSEESSRFIKLAESATEPFDRQREILYKFLLVFVRQE